MPLNLIKMRRSSEQEVGNMRRAHRIVLFLIAVLAIATFVFGVLALIGLKK